MGRAGGGRRKGVGKVCTERGLVAVHECHLLQGNETETNQGYNKKLLWLLLEFL